MSGNLIKPSRRGFLFGAGAVLMAPAIVRVASLMPVSVIKPTPCRRCGSPYGHGPACTGWLDAEFLIQYTKQFMVVPASTMRILDLVESETLIVNRPLPTGASISNQIDDRHAPHSPTSTAHNDRLIQPA